MTSFAALAARATQIGLALGLEGYMRIDSWRAVTHLFSVRDFLTG